MPPPTSPLTPEEFETWKQEAKFPFGRRLAATIEAAWAERDALSKGLAVQMEASLRSAEALEDANARYTKAVTELQAEVAALKVQAEIDLATMKGKLLEVCDKVTSLIQERDKALVDAARIRSLLADAVKTLRFCAQWGGRSGRILDPQPGSKFDHVKKCLARLRPGLSSSPDDWLKRHDAEVRAQAFEEAATICEKSYKSTHPLGGPLHTVLLRDRAAKEKTDT